MNLIYPLFQIVKDNPDIISIIEEEQKISYKELWERIDSLGNALSKIGLKKGDKVAIILPNCKEFIFSFFALLKIDAIAVPLEPIFTTYEYKEMLEEFSPCVIITSSYILTKVLAYERLLLAGKKIIVSDTDPWIKVKYPDSLNFEDLYKMGKPSKIIETNNKSNQVASINYTYRGYGYPVGAMLTHENYFYCSNAISSGGLAGSKRYLTVLPMPHIFALLTYVIEPLLKGATVIILKSHAAWEFLEAVKKYEVDIIFGVPTFYLYLMKSYDKSKFDLSSIKCGITGASFLSSELQKEVEKSLGIKILQGYGLTEGLIVSQNLMSKNKPGTLGVPLNGVKVKITTNDEREERRTGIKGEITISGPTVMKGFYKKEKETKDVLKDGWLYTGDYGKIDKDGYLYFEGLKKNIIKVGGHSVDLKEIEKVILFHPNVYSVKIYPEVDEFWGEIVAAEISLGKKTTKEEINKFCSEKLAIYKIPKSINLIEKEKPKILIIEDDLECLEFYTYILKEEGYEVSKATTGYEAIEEVRKGFFNLIILDLVLPDKDGIKIIEGIKKINDKISIVMITGYPSLLISVDLMKEGIFDYLAKPVTPNQLKDIVKKALKKGTPP